MALVVFDRCKTMLSALKRQETENTCEMHPDEQTTWWQGWVILPLLLFPQSNVILDPYEEAGM